MLMVVVIMPMVVVSRMRLTATHLGEIAVGIGLKLGAAMFRAEVKGVALMVRLERSIGIHLHAADRIDLPQAAGAVRPVRRHNRIVPIPPMGIKPV